MGRFFMIKNDAMIVFLRLDFLSVGGGAWRQDGTRHATHLHALCLAHDRAQEKGLKGPPYF